MQCCHRNPANVRIVIFSPDTDVLALAVANHHLLLRNTSVSMVSGVINVEHIARALGRQRANTLPALPAFSGADIVGKFNQLGKAKWLKIFMKSGSDTIGALGQLLIVNETSAQQLAILASCVWVQLTAKKDLRLTASMHFDGTCSANIWQRSTSFHRRRESSNSTFWVSMSKLAYGDRPISHNRSS